jgi:hypothetical protein
MKTCVTCRKTSQSYTKHHTFNVANCDENGFARCVYCGIRYDQV